jgi:hypothetical protein
MALKTPKVVLLVLLSCLGVPGLVGACAPATASPAVQGVPQQSASAPPAAASAAGSGTLELSFFYNSPLETHPTYHTAVWLEDEGGRLVRTLFVSTELAATEYKIETACPDWVKVANWAAAPKDDVAALQGPTPGVGMGDLTFDLAKLGVAPGTYQFRFQVHVTEEYNVLYRGRLAVDGQTRGVSLETVFGPGKLETNEVFIRDVSLRYVAPQQ